MSATPALLLAAGGVGFGHAVMPDHWAPLAVVGRTRHYPLAKVARLSSLAGVAHVAVSLVLGAVIVAIGLQFQHSIEAAQNAIIGSILIATGIGFLLLELSGHGHAHSHDHVHPHHHPHPHDPEHPHAQDPEHPGSRVSSIAAVMVPFGAAASPDLTILPVFLAAAGAGAGAAAASLVVFAAVTIATIVGLTLAATVGGYQVEGAWLERWGNAITAAVLLVIGTLVLLGVL